MGESFEPHNRESPNFLQDYTVGQIVQELEDCPDGEIICERGLEDCLESGYGQEEQECSLIYEIGVDSVRIRFREDKKTIEGYEDAKRSLEAWLKSSQSR